MKIFSDSAGIEWTVVEIEASALSTLPRSSLRHPEFKDGWLLFQSETTKKRLAPYPDDWRTMPAEDLERLCAKARTAPTVTSPSLTGEFRRFRPQLNDEG